MVGGAKIATEWIGGNVISLSSLPGSTASHPLSINNTGEVVGYSNVVDGAVATEWSGGQVIDLGGPLPGTMFLGGTADGINDAGEVVGYNVLAFPEPSTWAMMLLGFAGLAFAGYRRSERVFGQNARLFNSRFTN